MSDNEKRAEERFSIKQLVGLSSSGDIFLSAEGLDLSLGGMSCAVDKPLEANTRVQLMIGLPYVAGDHLLKCEGVVAHSRMENGVCVVGIEFAAMDPESRSMLEEHLSVIGPRT